MTTLVQPLAGIRSHAVGGIACVEVGMLLFVVQDGLMKSLLGEFTVWMLILTRSVVTVIVLTPTILFLGGPHRLITPLWPLHFARAALFAVGFSLFYAAFPFMGLAEVTTIFFAAPLITAVLAAFFLRETIGLHRIGALALGFLGVLIAMNPTGEAFQWIAVLPLLCALTYAVSQVIARQIGDRETTLTTGLMTIAFAGIIIVPLGYAVSHLVDPGPNFQHLRWDWRLPDAEHLHLLALLGAVGMVGYMLLSRAYQIAPASLIAPFDYTYLPFATAMAYLVWGEVPVWNTLVGMALIVIGGAYLGYREIIAARRVIEPAPTAEAVFVPGNPAGALAHLTDTLDDRVDSTISS